MGWFQPFKFPTIPHPQFLSAISYNFSSLYLELLNRLRFTIYYHHAIVISRPVPSLTSALRNGFLQTLNFLIFQLSLTLNVNLLTIPTNSQFPSPHLGTSKWTALNRSVARCLISTTRARWIASRGSSEFWRSKMDFERNRYLIFVTFCSKWSHSNIVQPRKQKVRRLSGVPSQTLICGYLVLLQIRSLALPSQRLQLQQSVCNEMRKSRTEKKNRNALSERTAATRWTRAINQFHKHGGTLIVIRNRRMRYNQMKTETIS